MTRPRGELTTYRARGGHATEWANPTWWSVNTHHNADTALQAYMCVSCWNTFPAKHDKESYQLLSESKNIILPERKIKTESLLLDGNFRNILKLSWFNIFPQKFFDNNITFSQTSTEGYAAQFTKSTTPHCGASFSSSNRSHQQT